MKTNIIMKDSFAPVFPAKLWKRKKEEVLYKKKKIKVNVGAFMGSKVIDALLNDERGIK